MNTKLILCTTLIYACNASAMLTEAVRQSARMSRQAAASVLAPDRNNLHTNMNRFALLPSQKFSAPMNIKRNFSYKTTIDDLKEKIENAANSNEVMKDKLKVGLGGTVASYTVLYLAYTSYHIANNIPAPFSLPFAFLSVSGFFVGAVGATVCPIAAIYTTCRYIPNSVYLALLKAQLAKQQRADEPQKKSRVELSDE